MVPVSMRVAEKTAKDAFLECEQSVTSPKFCRANPVKALVLLVVEKSKRVGERGQLI